MILRRVFPDCDISLDADDQDVRNRVAELYRAPRADWLRINLITTVSGSAAGSDGSSETITNPVDRIILNTLRSLADVVLVGAASVRKEGYFVPRDSAFAIITGSGDFSGHQLKTTGTHGPLLILCPAVSVERARATVGIPDVDVIAVPDVDGSLSADAIVTALRGAGYASIVAEGGPAVAAHLVTGGVVDEVCLTTSPELNGAKLPVFGAHEFDPVPLTLDQLLVDDSGATYARWGIANSSS